MRMLKSGLKLVLDTDWIFDEDDKLEDIVAKCNVYEGTKYLYYDIIDEVYQLQGFDVKLPTNHRYIMTYYNANDDFASTVAFNTFGIEEMYEVDANANPDQVGYQVLFLWYYSVDDEAVSGFDYVNLIANYGIRINPIWMGNCTIRIYQLD